MSELINDKLAKEIKEILSKVPQPVRLLFFSQDAPCEYCRQQEEILRAVSKASKKISLEVRDLVKDSGLAREYGIRRIPATAVIGSKDYGIRFYGVTAGYEFRSLMDAIVMVSGGISGLGPDIEGILKLLDVPVHLEVMVTLTCPYCPGMVHTAHRMAVASDNIRADMIDSAEFPQLVQKYSVQGVPRTVINGAHAFDGALPEADALMEILKAVRPDLHERLDEETRRSRGEMAARRAEPGEAYEVLIVGAGPAAYSAAIYSVRKGLKTAVIGEHPGGQITDTAGIENWLGIPGISGQDMARAFRSHVERYPVAELKGVAVESVERRGEKFLVRASGDRTFEALSVIYCAGKQYRRLDVPGEDRFIGRGIAFCATCDAPLYRDRAVAVVGGGNSAFTAARDLLPFAREIHIINITQGFQADPPLIGEVTAAPHVRLHPSTQVMEFLGSDSLQGVRVQSADGVRRFDIMVEGVFLEIGLTPNTGAVKGLIDLNENGEIPVQRDQSTAVPGFFAAGDVTDEPVKQIVVAAGAGAKAALAAYEHVMGMSRAARP